MFKPSPIQTYLTELARQHGLQLIQPGKKVYFWLENTDQRHLHIWTMERSIMIGQTVESAEGKMEKQRVVCFATCLSNYLPVLYWLPFIGSLLIRRWLCICITSKGLPLNLVASEQTPAKQSPSLDLDAEYYRSSRSLLSLMHREQWCNQWLSVLQAEGWHLHAVRHTKADGSDVEIDERRMRR